MRRAADIGSSRALCREARIEDVPGRIACMLASSYNPLLVALSLAMAITASFTTLELTRRVATSTGAAARIWLTAGAFSMGVGIWTMHFIGMLALETDMHFSYDLPLTLVSLVVGIAASGFALRVASRRDGGPVRLVTAGVLLGAGIAGMHYTGMAAMRMEARIVYDPLIVALSVMVAVGAAIAALWMSSALAASHERGPWKHKLGAAAIMGLAICGMHYLGMLAARYVPDATLAHTATPLPDHFVAAAIGIASILILAATHLTLFFDYKLGAQERLGAQLRTLVGERTNEIETQAEFLRRSKTQLLREVAHNRRLNTIVEQATDAICVTNVDRTIEYVNPQFEREYGIAGEELRGKTAREMGWGRSNPAVYDEMHTAALAGRSWSGHLRSESRSGAVIDHDVVASPIFDAAGEVTQYVQFRRNVTERMRLQQQLQQAQKLESIGQLASGIAHEINTPSQYVGDNTRFLQQAFSDLNELIARLEQMLEAGDAPIPRDALASCLDGADVEYLLGEIPRAIEQSLEGINRITTIVGAMKEFSHPSQEMSLIDLNRAIESTVTVATNEWKYFADMQLELDSDLPAVACIPNDINQAVLNIVVNAAHAIADVVGDTSARGTITIGTRRRDGNVEIRIADTGKGMNERIKSRIFDPFFTTKEVGRGTGQGLSMVHNVIVEKHGGSITVDSEPGLGSCFTIYLPIDQSAATRSPAAA
jgi:PAS domain S-box-containing protein